MANQNNKTNNNEMTFDERVTLLKSYIQRVTDGEALESVQKDFKENFSNVAAEEIAKAEQVMMKEGTSMKDITKLCDIHSVLFHDMTDEERMERLKEEMEAHKVVKLQPEEKEEEFDDETSKLTIEYKNTTGHALNILTSENEALKKLLDNLNTKIAEDLDIKKELEQLSTITTHYSKKDEMLFPLLKDKYDYPGPSDVMWSVEDEIILELKSIMKEEKYDKERLTKVLKRMEEMIYKEENILFPLCVSNFTEEEWTQIAVDMKLYGPFLIEKLPEGNYKIDKTNEIELSDDKIQLPGGTITLKQLRSMLNIIPMEITIIDENNRNTFFDEDENKVFLRPKMALYRDVFSCHPPRVTKMVEKLIDDFKTGKRDSMHVLSTAHGIKVLTNYYALRDDDGTYLGTMEAVLHLDSIIEHVLNGDEGLIEL